MNLKNKVKGYEVSVSLKTKTTVEEGPMKVLKDLANEIGQEKL